MTEPASTEPEGNPRPLDYRKWEGLRLPRRWTILGAFLLVALLLTGWWGWTKYSAKRHLAAVEAIRKMGGRVLLDQKTGKVDRVYLNDLGDQSLIDMKRDLAWLGPVREVDLVGKRISDDGMAALHGMKKIDVVHVFNTSVTEKGVERLKKAHPKVQVKTGRPDPVGTGLARASIYRHAIVTLAFADDGRLFTGSGDGKLRVWDVRRQQVIQTIDAHEKWLFSIAISPEKDVIATGGGDSVIRLWDLRTLKLKSELRGHTDDVHAVAFGPTGQTLASAGDDKTVRIWDVPTARELHTLRAHTRSIPSLKRSPDGKQVISASRDKTLIAWDIATGQQLWRATGHDADVNQIAVLPDGRVASASYDGTIRLWQAGQEIARGDGHAGRVYSIAADPAAPRLYSAGEDNAIHAWDITPTGLKELNLPRPQTLVAAMTFDRDSRLTSAGADGQIKFWADTAGRESLVLIPPFDGE